MLPPGTQVGRYEIQGTLGRGGMGTVYVAHDPVLGRMVAIKLFPNDIDLPDASERFLREARSPAALSHPNIVAVYDFGDYESHPYIAMEYVQGETLAEIIRRRATVSLAAKLRWIEELCDGIAYAHKFGVVHRDIKPANLIIDTGGQLKILDFGIARLIGAEAVAALVDTFRHMAPEQLQGRPVDHRSDLFSIGVVFYELLSYTPAFRGTTPSDLLRRIAVEEPIPLTTLVPEIDDELPSIVERALRKNPNDRFPDAESMRSAVVTVRRRIEHGGPSVDSILSDHGSPTDLLDEDDPPTGTMPVPPRPVAQARPRASTPLPRPTTSPDETTYTPGRRERGRYTVWFGTDRRRIDRNGSCVGFSAERSSTIHYGWCRVAIPESHRIGSTGSPWWRRLLTLTDDRLKLLGVVQLPETEYWAQIATLLRRGPVLEREAVVFLHGYNVSFEQAALRAAQMGYDLGIAGVMAFYSWPSKGTLAGYPADEATIEASEEFVTKFLTDMATRSGATRVHIIAHSMGNRALLRAIDRIASRAAGLTDTPFGQIILAAADVDRDTFARLSTSYKSVARRTTMYVCERDRAVEASHWLHDFPRAGLVPPVLVVPGIDTINVSNLDLTLLGHGYVAEARDVLQDMHRLIREDSPPDRRFGLRKVIMAQGGTYWTVGR